MSELIVRCLILFCTLTPSGQCDRAVAFTEAETQEIATAPRTRWTSPAHQACQARLQELRERGPAPSADGRGERPIWAEPVRGQSERRSPAVAEAE